jgi:murein DD-endopeptidase MepM/ murein hydrolase activator NlpD
MNQARWRADLSAAAPWLVATVLLVAAWIAVRGGNQMPRQWAAPPAVDVTAGTGAVSSAPSIAPEAAAPAVEPSSLTDNDDVVELRRRRLPLPVEGVAAAMLVPTFHQARDGREHEAIDILAPRGTAVIAVEDGKIAKLFTSVRGGQTIYLFDPSSVYCYYYAHLDQYADRLHDGQDVVRGEVIGYVGTTGNAPPNTPHLHFAVFKLGPEKHWWQGTAIDPYLIWR